MRAFPGSWRLSVLAALAVLAMSLSPVASAEIYFEQVDVEIGPQSIDARLTGHTINGSDAQELRYWIDRDYGDGDGEVTEEEVDAFVTARKQEYNDQLRLGGAFFFQSFQIRERPAITQEVTAITFSQEVLGEVMSEDAIVQDVDALLTFADTQRSRVPVSFAGDFSAPFRQVGMSWGQATFHTSEPWAIDPESISPEGKENRFFHGERFIVPYDESGEFSSSETPLTFEIVDTSEEPLDDESKDSPGPVVGVVLVLVGSGAWVARAGRRCQQ
jgi:hypothetical protein